MKKNNNIFLDTYSISELKGYGWKTNDIIFIKKRVIELNPIWSKVKKSDRIKFLMDIGPMTRKEAHENDSRDLSGLPLEILSDYLLKKVEESFGGVK